ncbi:MAG: cupin domain-containing protein [Gammaproteobacteria bacterium]|jgi:quercetin dioxygenase-like cupin family protein|nr:cupin domain-containing protein [Gammaproteobacteria bacterium]
MLKLKQEARIGSKHRPPILAALLSLAIACLWPASFAAQLEGGFEIVQLADMEWDETSDRVQQKVLYGNPSEEGLYIIRVRFPAGGTSRPHFHSQDRFVTVIEGTWNAGIDASHDMTNTTPIPAGGFMMHPAGAVHYDGSRGDAVVVEIRGFGPVTTTSVDIEP